MSDDPRAAVPRRHGIFRASSALLSIATALAAVSLVTTPEAAAAAGPVAHTSYNSMGVGWNPDTYWRVQAKEPDRVGYVPDPLGQRGIVQHIEVRPGDANVFGSTSKAERASVIRVGAKQGDLGGFLNGQTVVMSWSTMIDSSFTSPPRDWNIFADFHASGGKIGSPWQLSLSGDEAKLRLRLYGGGQWVDGGQPAGSEFEFFTLGTVTKNKWHDFVTEVKFDCTGHGFTRIWMDGDQLIDATDRKIGYCGDPGMYWKQGFYREVWDKPTQLWFADTFRWKTATVALAHYGWTGHR